MFEADSSSSLGSGSKVVSGQQSEAETPSPTPDKATQVDSITSIASKNPETTKEEDARPEQSNMLSSTGNPPVKSRNKTQKVCGVCGDSAKSFHFGGLSCDSCKAFFRRSVHKDAHLAFQCAYHAECEITKESRKACQFCRFQKCLGIGMEKKWVMTDQEKTQLIQQRKEKKDTSDDPEVVIPNKEERSETDYEPDVARMLEFMTADERDEIECIVNKYQHSYREIPFRVSKVDGTRNSVEIIQMFTTILRRFAYFTKLLPEFTQLSVTDQSALLRGSVLEMCLLRGALSFDFKSNRWPKTENMEFLKDCPQLRVEDMEKLVSRDLYEMHMQFINGIQELGADEATVMILLLIVLFYPDRTTLQAAEYIGRVQEKYLLLLNKYVQWRYGPKGTRTFPKLLAKLADLRQLNDSHTEYNLKMTKNEVEKIQEQLGNINLNPYPQWVLVEDQVGSQGPSQTQSSKPMSPPGQAPHTIGGFQPPPEGYYPQLQHQHQHAVSGSAMPSFQDLYNQNLPQQHPQYLPQPPAEPSARDFFMQFVNRKIPVLINNPFAPFPMETELENARAFFQTMGNQQQASNIQHPAATQQHQHATMEMQTPPGSDPMSQFRELLESSDPNMLRQLKESMSPDLVSKLQSVFGNSDGRGQGVTGSTAALPFDLTKIPPELIANYMSGGDGRGPSDLHQLASQYGFSGGSTGFPTQTIPGNAGYTGTPNYSQWQAEPHPLAYQTGPEMMQHFQELQQQFSFPSTDQHHLLTQPQQPMETRYAPNEDQIHARQYFQQPHQQCHEHYTNWDYQ